MNNNEMRRSVALWHVMVDGEWLSVEYDGYAPVNVEVNGTFHPVTFRHMALGCERSSCRDLLVWG